MQLENQFEQHLLISKILIAAAVLACGSVVLSVPLSMIPVSSSVW